MKTKKILPLIFSAVALILEVSPCGAVCNFATPEKTIRRTFSYFSLVPFGYANFAPFITAVLTVVLLLLCALSLVMGEKFLSKTRRYLYITAAILSFMPMALGVRYYSLTGAAVSMCLVLGALSLIITKKGGSSDETQ